MNKIEIKTRDGHCPSFVFRPAGSGPWPAVLIFMDGLGIRPAMLEIGERLSAHGYYALLPDLFYRSGPYAPMDPHAIFSDPAQRKILMDKYFALATPGQHHVRHARISRLPRRTARRAARRHRHNRLLHGRIHVADRRGNLSGSNCGHRVVSRRPARDRCAESPHLLAPRIKSRVYVAGAIEDQSFPDDMKKRLEEALTKANIDHEIETYPAKHGWVFRDTPAYDAAASERHWQTMLALFDATLRS